MKLKHSIEQIMITEVKHYMTDDGSEFETYKEAQEYEKLYEKCKLIMNHLVQEPNGECAIQHNVDVIKKAYKEFMDLCGKIIPSYKYIFDATVNGNAHPSHAERIISDNGYECLCHTNYRFRCMNMSSGIEYEQPYYVTHENEWKGKILRYN